ncbi:MAG TPA: hypothetical protein VMQ61_01155 [Thermoanaerobaculia bacterium]|nr:hypothetical protein [Thermoanaerobaculia bacterium]
MHTLDRFAITRRLFVLAASALLALPAPGAAAGPGSVTGSMTTAGKTYKLAHVYARRQPSVADKTQTVVVVLLTDNEVPKSIVDDKYRLELTDMARAGKIHGLAVTIGLDKKPSGTGWVYAKEVGGAIVNRADQQTFEPGRFDDSQVEGKVSGHGSFGDDKWDYAASFKAAVATMK